MEVSFKHIFRVFLRQCVCVYVCVCACVHARVSVCLSVYSYSTRERERGILHESVITAEKWWVWDMVLGWGLQPPTIDLWHFWALTVIPCCYVTGVGEAFQPRHISWDLTALDSGFAGFSHVRHARENCFTRSLLGKTDRQREREREKLCVCVCVCVCICVRQMREA